MKHALTATNILPLADFKVRATELLNAQREFGEPIVITQNGKAAAVLVPPEEYDFLVRRAAFVGAVERGLADADAGRSRDQADVAVQIITVFEGHRLLDPRIAEN